MQPIEKIYMEFKHNLGMIPNEVRVCGWPRMAASIFSEWVKTDVSVHLVFIYPSIILPALYPLVSWESASACLQLT